MYDYLRRMLEDGRLRPGDFVNMDGLARELGISRTPLRDALIQLEAEGFVVFFPRHGVMVARLTLQDIKDFYQIIGALESTVVLQEGEKLSPDDVERMRELNARMKECIAADDFDGYYARNLEFHNTYLFLTQNKKLIRTVLTYKQRLYDFPRRQKFIKEWEVASIGEHDQLIELFARRDFEGASAFIRDVHWSFSRQERYIRRYYALEIYDLEGGEAP